MIRHAQKLMGRVYQLVLLELAWFTGWYTQAGRYGFASYYVTAPQVGNGLLRLRGRMVSVRHDTGGIW